MSYTKTTNKIQVAVTPVFLPDQSSHRDGFYVWAYSICICNLRETPAQLLHRYWRIIDANGVVQEVTGNGVVGESPILSPNEEYIYTSGASLRQPSGVMHGYYLMKDLVLDKTLKIEIPAFSLDSPFEAHKPI